jgi:CheY-like chemotaxis protein
VLSRAARARVRRLDLLAFGPLVGERGDRELFAVPPKLVAVTGYGHSSDRVRSREAGFDLHLVKPVDLTAIQDALAKLGS